MDEYLQTVLKRHPGGRPPKVPATPEGLWDSFAEYVALSANNPIKLNTATKDGPLYSARPLSRQGFLAFLGVGYTWSKFRNYYEQRPGFDVVLGQIANIIETQQLEGAAVGNYNANIVARLNGYRDALDHTSDGEKLDLVINLK